MKFVKIALLILITAFFFVAADRLLMPKYMSQSHEGRLTREYYSSEKNHSVIFIGDCEAHENISPAELWRTYGITSYIRGGAQQLIWHSYYLLEDTLRYETPDVVVLSVMAMQYGEPRGEEYNRLNLEGMRFSPTKIRAVRASVLPEEDTLSYFLPILRYHERWKELNRDDFNYFFRRKNVAHNGYMMRSGVMAVDFENFIPGRRLADYSLPDICWEYLDKARELCAEKGIELVLVKAPTIYPYWYREWDDQIAAYADRHGLLYVNLLELADEAGIDYSIHSYNAGFHFNVQGAETIARFFGGILTDNFNLPDMRGDDQTAAVWERKLEAYDAMKAAQEREIAETGRIRTLTY
ncbi:MAG: SGNH/GDSL hydrolase family protein [Defluviitaleaceae bacterium]|nr:SGNH/GDSL hydrolase family protein [Defluviitaleaceae bacterium]